MRRTCQRFIVIDDNITYGCLFKVCTYLLSVCFPCVQVVGIGLRSVFELIRESVTTHPALCTRALQALLDMLQGQMPEGLAKEPDDIIGKI